MSSNGMLWTPERDAILSAKWAEGIKTADIAAQMGGFDHTKDGGKGAVLGRAHRLKLAPRATGIARLHPVEAERRRQIHNSKRAERRRVARANGTEAKAPSRFISQNKRLRELDQRFEAAGLPKVSKTSAAYRNQLGTTGNLTKSQLYAMLAEAARNTAEMSV